MAACNNASTEEKKADSTNKAIDSTAGAKKDSVSANADSLKKTIDSSAAAKKDSVAPKK